jgi:hypothetical protein
MISTWLPTAATASITWSPSKPQKRKSRAPFLLFLLLIIGGAAFAAYKVFLGGDMGDMMNMQPQTPPAIVAEAPVTPNLPEGVTASTEPTTGPASVKDMLASSLNPAAPVTEACHRCNCAC